MVKFIDIASSKEVAVSKFTVAYLRDVSSMGGAPKTTIYLAGGVTFTVAQSVDAVVAALNVA